MKLAPTLAVVSVKTIGEKINSRGQANKNETVSAKTIGKREQYLIPPAL